MNSIALLLILAEIAGYTYVFHRFGRVPVVVAPAVYVSATVICLYASDFLGLLWYARWTIHLVGWAAFAFLVRDWIMRSPANARAALSAERNVAAMCVLFIVLAFLLLEANQHSLFWNWDEFSYWGSVIKLIAEANSFHFKLNTLQFQDYPPGAALFAYHVLGLRGYAEGMAIVSYDIILLAFLMPIVAKSFSANFLFGLVTTVLCYLLMIVLGHGWDSVNIDHILSVVFAGAVAAYFTMGFASGGMFVVALMLAALALIKQSGPYLGVVAAAICSVDMIICRLFAQAGPESGVNDRRFRLVHFIWIAAIFAAPLVMSASWKTYVKANGIAPAWGSVELGSILPGTLKCCETAREVNVTNTYFARYFRVPKGEATKGSIGSIAKDNLKKIEFTASLPKIAGSTLSVFGFLMLSWLVIVLLLNNGVDRWRGVAVIAILSGGMIAFSLSILLTYVYIFSAIESAEVGSFERYHNTYVLAAFLMAFFWIGMTIARMGLVGRWLTAVVVAAWAYDFAYSASPALFSFHYNETVTKRTALRLELKTIADPAIRLIPPDKRVYVSWLDTQGMEFNMMRYELLPRVSNLYCHSFVARPPVPEVETCVLSEVALSDSLRNFDYAIVGEGLARMKEDYPSIWSREIPDNVTLFRIDKSQALVKMAPLTP